MASRKLLWQILPSYGFIVLVAIVAMTLYTFRAMQSYFIEETRRSLLQQAQSMALHLSAYIDPLEEAEILRLCRRINESTDYWFTVTLPDGTMLCGRNQEQPPGTRASPGLAAALAGRTVTDIEYLPETGVRVMYTTAPIYNDRQQVRAALTVSKPYLGVQQALRSMTDKLITVAVLVLAASVITGIVMAKRISAPLENIRRAAERFAQGDFTLRIPATSSQELEHLASTMNGMAQRLSETLALMNRQQSEQRAMLASMTEGVIAIDSNERVLNMNAAAARLLDLTEGRARGKSIQEIIRHAALQEFMLSALSVTDAPIEKNIVLYDKQVKYLLARASSLKDESNRTIGALIVLHDVTEVQRLERVRRDFVANVSHELKTPITSIKGFVETLLESSLDEPEAARRFLDIVAKQTDRLDAIIDDLLLLSRMEQDNERQSISFQDENLRQIIGGAIQICEKNAQEKKIDIDVYCDPNLAAPVNAHLIEQAVVNLIDNAVKYSDEGKTVRVEAESNGEEAVLRVIDQGCGIERRDIPRLFERFYRVDKARSRKMGGTGLGLAIVKHIMQAHGGRVAVESNPGKGSVFLMAVPLNRLDMETRQTLLALEMENENRGNG